MTGIKRKKNAVAFVIFGVTGDLARRKLLPAFYQLASENRLPSKVDFIGFARRPWNVEKMRQVLTNGIEEFARIKPVNGNVVKELLESSNYVQSTFEDNSGYVKLFKYLEDKGYKKILFYLATPPNYYTTIINNLKACRNYSNNREWVRIVVEKPYGQDLATAKTLEKTIHTCFEEDQIYRIDHYLGKETVQNILVFRFANGIFEPLWNNKYIDHVQITVAETVGVGTRAGYFDKVGIMRDMFANHMLQLLTLTAMEAPYAFNADSVRDEKMKVIRSLRPLTGEKAIENTVRAQYSENSISGKTIKGYKQEEGVPDNSITETYLAAKVNIDNWRWSQTPFYLRTGKRLQKRATEIAIHFKQVPLSLFDWKNMAGEAPNVLILRVQPDEGINLTIGAKLPGPVNQIAPVEMEFCYEDSFGSDPPEAYERLLVDCIQGDQTLFTRTDEVIEQWRFVEGIRQAWDSNPAKELPKYEAGTWGPLEAEISIQKDNRNWRNPA
jgi:glucose-6-phosphate 1-dehydrogenase